MVSHLLPNLSRYSFTLLLGVILLSDAVGATGRNPQLQIAQHSETTQQDATRAEAEKAFQKGMQLFQQETGESLRQARQKFQEALKLWQQIDDKSRQGLSLLFIGRIYSYLGEQQQAL